MRSGGPLGSGAAPRGHAVLPLVDPLHWGGAQREPSLAALAGARTAPARPRPFPCPGSGWRGPPRGSGRPGAPTPGAIRLFPLVRFRSFSVCRVLKGSPPPTPSQPLPFTSPSDLGWFF